MAEIFYGFGHGKHLISLFLHQCLFISLQQKNLLLEVRGYMESLIVRSLIHRNNDNLVFSNQQRCKIEKDSTNGAVDCRSNISFYPCDSIHYRKSTSIFSDFCTLRASPTNQLSMLLNWILRNGMKIGAPTISWSLLKSLLDSPHYLVYSSILFF